MPSRRWFPFAGEVMDAAGEFLLWMQRQAWFWPMNALICGGGWIVYGIYLWRESKDERQPKDKR